MTVSIFWDRNEANKEILNKYDELWTQFVEPIGASTTIGGEVFRALSRLIYEIHNNGYTDNNYSGAMRYVESYFKPSNKEVEGALIFAKIQTEYAWIGDNEKSEEVEDAIIEAIDAVMIDVINSYYDENHPFHNAWFEINNIDFFDYNIDDDEFLSYGDWEEDEDEEDYEW